MSRAATPSVRGSRRWRSHGRGSRTSWHRRQHPRPAGAAPARVSAGSPVAGGLRPWPDGPGECPRHGPPRGRMCLVRILLWHGYLLGGTGSNVYTPPARPGVVAGRARGNGPQPGASAGGLRPRWRGDRAAGRRRFPARLRARPLRGLRRRPPGSRLHAGGARAMGRRQRGGRTRASARRPRLRQPRAARRPGRGRDGGAVRREGARLGARVRDARAPGPRRLGGAVARGRARDVRGLGATSATW